MGGDEYAIIFYEGPPYKYVRTIKQHVNFINQVKYSNEGKYFVSVSSDKRIIIYNGLTGEVIKQQNNAH